MEDLPDKLEQRWHYFNRRFKVAKDQQEHFLRAHFNGCRTTIEDLCIDLFGMNWVLIHLNGKHE